MLDFRIETFLCVCKHMNYTKAAQELNITQPGVSQHIKYLEKYYGDKLFLYHNKKLTLTSAGLSLRDTMISVKHDNLYLKQKIKEQAEDHSSVKFGATLTIGDFLLPLKIATFLQKNPNTNLEVTVANTKELLQLLEDGKLDFAMVEGYFQKSGYENQILSNEKYVLVCGANYPLEKGLELKDLFCHNLLLREDGSGTKEILERYLLEHGYTFSDFSNTVVLSSIHVIKQLLATGYGISFMYEIAVKKEVEEGILRIVPVQNFDVYHEFNTIWRKNSVFCDYFKTISSL